MKICKNQFYVAGVILLLINESKNSYATESDLCFLYTRASWTDDLQTSEVEKRIRRIKKMLRDVHSSRTKGVKSLERLGLVSWDETTDSYSHGIRASEFLRSATTAVGSTSPDDLWPLKKWLLQEEKASADNPPRP